MRVTCSVTPSGNTRDHSVSFVVLVGGTIKPRRARQPLVE
jgi:hypothetical protein